MKKITVITVIAILGLTISGCKKFLDREPIASETNVGYYDTFENAEKAVNAIYDPITLEQRLYLALLWALGDAASDDTEAGGGKNWKGEDQPAAQEICLYRTLPSNAYSNNFFKMSYVGIQRANNLLRETKKVNYDARRLQGEARVLRAYYYFNLVNVYGPVPYFKEQPLPEEYTTISNRQEGDDAEGNKHVKYIYEQIIGDLDTASTLLPPKSAYKDKNLIGRVSQGTAWAYIAKVYAYLASNPNLEGDKNSYWAKCAEYADKVINSGEYSLVNEYHKLYTLEGENGPESIFEAQFLAGSQDGPTYEGAILNIDLAPRSFLKKKYDQSSGELYCYGLNCPTISLVNSYEIKDKTSKMTNFGAIMSNAGTNYLKIDLYNDGYDWDPRLDMIAKPGDSVLQSVNSKEGWFLLKTRDDDPIDEKASPTGFWGRKTELRYDQWGTVQATGLNHHLFRYAELLLLRAEAAIKLGDEATALKYVNMVRERARKSKRIPNGTGGYTYTNGTVPADLTSVTYDDILKERRRELALEHNRFFDLVRTGKAEEILSQRGLDSWGRKFNWKSGVSHRLPIPSTVIIESGGAIKQNKGY
ncbi:MAG: RagB/SusD family nutrient uptake outer membrane protein [Bacteroidales bacterium]